MAQPCWSQGSAAGSKLRQQCDKMANLVQLEFLRGRIGVYGVRGLKGIVNILIMRDPDHEYLTESLMFNISRQQRMILLLLNGPRCTGYYDIENMAKFWLMCMI